MSSYTSTDYPSRYEVFDFGAINWDVILDRACNIRGDHSAQFTGHAFHHGFFYMDRYLRFHDGLIWIARVRTPGPRYLAGGPAMLSAEQCLESELAAARFLRDKTSFRFQEVYGYDLAARVEVGAPFMIIEYVGETTATELRDKRNGSDSNLFGTKKQDRKFRKQMTHIQAKLASFTFPEIGSLNWDESADAFFIGPELRTGKGPWTSSAKYFSDLANHELQACSESGMENVLSSQSFALPSVFSHLMKVYSYECPVQGQEYHLMDQKLGADNLLVDDDFNVVGFLEWDGFMAAPIQQAAQFPRNSGLSRLPSAEADIEPYEFDRFETIGPQLTEYFQLLRMAERGRGAKVSGMMDSYGAFIMQGLLQYGVHAADDSAARGTSIWTDTPETLGRHLYDARYRRANDEWMVQYAKLLQRGIGPYLERCRDGEDDESGSGDGSVSSESSREIVD